MAQQLCPLVARTAELEVVSRELARHFNHPGSRRGSTNGPLPLANGGNMEQQQQQLQQQLQSLITPEQVVNHLSLKASKSSNKHMLAFYLFEVCLGLKEFFAMREEMLPLERKTLEMRPHFQV